MQGKSIVVAVLLASMANVASGQEPSTESILRERLAGVVGRLPSQSMIRVGRDSSTIEGRLSRSVRDTLWIRDKSGATTPVPFSATDRLWTRETNAIAGAIAGALLGAVFLGAVGSTTDDVISTFCQPSSCTSSGGGSNTSLGLVVGGFGGAVVGLVAGKLIKRWKSRYP